MRATVTGLGRKQSFGIAYSYVGVSMLCSMLMLFCTSGVLNLFRVPFSEKTGIPEATLLSVVTIAGICAQVCHFLVGKVLMSRAGARVSISVSLILGGLLGFILLSKTTTLTGWIVGVLSLQCSSVGFGMAPVGALITSWFCKRVNIPLGIANSGTSLSPLLGIPVVNKLMNVCGFETTCVWCGCFMIALGAICFVWIRNKPVDLGMFSDNLPVVQGAECQPESEKQEIKTGWSLLDLYKNKQAWLIALSFGLLLFITVGAGSSRVSWIMEYGYTLDAAVAINAGMAWLGLLFGAGSGVILEWLGTGRATKVFVGAAVISYASIVVLPDSKVVMFSVCAMMYITGAAWTPLLAATTLRAFGAEAFPNANRMILFSAMAVESLSYLYTGLAQTIFGSISGAYASYAAAAGIAWIIYCFVAGMSDKSCTDNVRPK